MEQLLIHCKSIQIRSPHRKKIRVKRIITIIYRACPGRVAISAISFAWQKHVAPITHAFISQYQNSFLHKNALSPVLRALIVLEL